MCKGNGQHGKVPTHMYTLLEIKNTLFNSPLFSRQKGYLRNRETCDFEQPLG